MTGAFNFEVAHQRVQQGTTEGLLDAADVVKQESIERTPLETGELRNDCTTAAVDNEAVVYYSLIYAARQHEEVGWHHQDGEAKFLENALIAKKDEVAAVIAQSIRRSLG
jgi:hypothetical protein